MQPLQRAEGVGPQIDGLFVAQDVRVPGLADHLARRGAEGFLAGHVEPQPVECGHHRRAGRIGAEANLLDPHRQEAPHRLVLVRQLDRVDVAMRTDCGDHPRQGLGQRLPGDLAERHRPDLAVRHLGVHHRLAHLGQYPGRQILLLQRAQPVGLFRLGGAGEQLLQQRIEHVQRIVLG